jgi:hypothetical protein
MMADWLRRLQAKWQEYAVNVVDSAYSGDCTLDKHQKMICKSATFECDNQQSAGFKRIFLDRAA